MISYTNHSSSHLVHLKSKQHKRVVRSTERKTFRRKLDNAIPSLLTTLDTLQARKISENDKESDSSEKDEELQI